MNRRWTIAVTGRAHCQRHVAFLIIFRAPFSFFCAPCSFFIFHLAPGFFILLHAPFHDLPLLHAPFCNFLCSLLQDYDFSAPCSFTYFTACSLFLCVKYGMFPAPGLPLTGVLISLLCGSKITMIMISCSE